MQLKNGNLVFLKEEILHTFSALHERVPQKQTRPFCIVIKDHKMPDIYWAIPITSSSLEKYKERAKHAPNRFRFYRVKGKECCFNISEMLPVIKSDIKMPYTSKEGLTLSIKRKEVKVLNRIIAITHTVKGLKQLSRYENIQQMLELTQKRLLQQENKPPTITFSRPQQGLERKL